MREQPSSCTLPHCKRFVPNREISHGKICGSRKGYGTLSDVPTSKLGIAKWEWDLIRALNFSGHHLSNYVNQPLFSCFPLKREPTKQHEFRRRNQLNNRERKNHVDPGFICLVDGSPPKKNRCLLKWAASHPNQPEICLLKLGSPWTTFTVDSWSLEKGRLLYSIPPDGICLGQMCFCFPPPLFSGTLNSC